MQVVVFGAHDAPRKRLALSYTSRRDHLRAGLPTAEVAIGQPCEALQGVSSGSALGTVCFPREAAQATNKGEIPLSRFGVALKLTASSVARGRIRS